MKISSAPVVRPLAARPAPALSLAEAPTTTFADLLGASENADAGRARGFDETGVIRRGDELPSADTAVDTPVLGAISPSAKAQTQGLPARASTDPASLAPAARSLSSGPMPHVAGATIAFTPQAAATPAHHVMVARWTPRVPPPTTDAADALQGAAPPKPRAPPPARGQGPSLVVRQEGDSVSLIARAPVPAAEASALLRAAADLAAQHGLTLEDFHLNGEPLATPLRRIKGGPDGHFRG